MEKIGLSETLERIRKIRKILKNNKNGLYHKQICILSNIKPTSLTELIHNYFYQKVLIIKDGKYKIFKIKDLTIPKKEERLIKRLKAIEKAKSLRKNGFSYSEIINILKKEFKMGIEIKSIRNIKMSERGSKRYFKKLMEDKKKAGSIAGKIHVITGHMYRMRLLSKKAMFKKAMARIPESSKVLSSSKIRILSHCLFDGYISNSGYTIGYCNTSKTLLNQFIKDMREVYHLEPGDVTCRENCSVVRYFSKAVLIDLKKYLNIKQGNETLKSEIMKMPSCWKAIFLRAFWDDEGMVGFKELRGKDGYLHTHRYLEAYQKNIKLLEQIKMMHNSLGVNAYIGSGNKLRISTEEHLKKFSNIIRFSPGVVSCKKLSRWYNIEKNKILGMAIKSYEI